MKRRKNPYAKRLKKQVTIRMGVDIIEYFKEMSITTGIPYQNLINLYLRDCVQSGRKLQMEWPSWFEHTRIENNHPGRFKWLDDNEMQEARQNNMPGFLSIASLIHPFPPVWKLHPQLPPRPVQPGLHRAQRHIKCIADLLISSRSYVFWDNGGQIILAICPPTYLFYNMICEFFKI